MRLRTIIIAAALLLAGTAVHAQDPALERVQNLINTGRLTDARNMLAQWERTQGLPTSDATPADRARALYLTGVLSQDPADAEDAFVGVVLSYPSSDVAPDALLRLGQGLYTAGDNARAIAYLRRLQSDYPPSTARETGALWLARAQIAEGELDAACSTARVGRAGTTNPNLRTLIELERDKACVNSPEPLSSAMDEPQPATPLPRPAAAQQDTRPQQQTPTQQPRPMPVDVPVRAQPSAPALPDLGVAVDANVREPEPQPRANPPVEERTGSVTPVATRTETETGSSTPRRAAADTNTGEFAVQTAAFSQRQAADRIAAELKAKGFEARVVTVPGSPLFRVRYGVFGTSRDAAAAALHVRDAGFATLVVSDVRLERRQ